MQEQTEIDAAKLEKVIDKIRKCLALAARAGTEGEAAAATARAQEMLAAYNLELSQLDVTGEQTADSKRIKDTYQRSAMFAYQRELWAAIAKANYCFYEAAPVYKWTKGGNYQRVSYHHFLIGREINVVASRMMGDYLEETINRLCPYTPGRDSSKSWISWKEGCTARLVERLEEKRREMERAEEEKRKEHEAAAAANPASSTALVVTYRDMIRHEEDENYRVKHGEQAWLRRIAYRDHDYETCACAICTERRAYWEGLEKMRAVATIEQPKKPETEAQRRKREEREERANERYWENQRKRERREWNRKDQRAYAAGQRTGDTISLNKQVKSGSDGKKLGK